MARYFRGSNPKLGLNNRTAHYEVMSDTYQEPDRDEYGDKISRGGYPHGYVSLVYDKGKELPNFDNRPFAQQHYGGLSERQQFLTTQGKEMPTELFDSDPVKIMIDSAYSHPDMRRHMPKLLAIAQMDNPDIKLTASDSLTQYSSDLARNAVSKGLVNRPPSNKDMAFTARRSRHNDATSRRNEVVSAPHGEGVPIPHKDVLRGEQFLRVALGRGPKPTPEPNYEQPRLPGME